MESIKTHILLHTLALFLISVILCCCTDERDKYEVPSGGHEKNVTFSVKVPGTGAPRSPDTYALTQNDENEVKQITVLLFDGSGNYVHYPIYSNKITTDPGDNAKKTFTVKVPEGTYDLVIFANANTTLGSALSNINVGDSKALVIGKLLLVNEGRWETNTSLGSYKPIPMWGEITGITISGTMPSNTPVTLSRMVSKIDVNLATTSAQNSFDLKSIRLYNYNDRGQVAPDAANWNSTTSIAIDPSVPLSANKLGNPTTNPATQPLLYDETTITKDPATSTRGISCSNQIYAFEASVGSSTNHLTNTCLVIGGRYMGDTQDSYYRIDLANSSGTTTTYLPLLRNHQYKININRISGSGLATPEDAFKARPVNIEASILEWNDGRFKDFVVNDQYMLGVSQVEFIFSQEKRDNNSRDNILSVITDYPAGWIIDKIIDADTNVAPSSWLTCNPGSGSNPVGDDLRLHMPINNTGNPRTAFIYLKAGRLKLEIKVTQNSIPALMLSIRDDVTNTIDLSELVFGAPTGVQPDAQSIRLSWMPDNRPVTASITELSNNAFRYAPESVNKPGTAEAIYTDPSGTKTLSIRPELFIPSESNPFEERTSKVDFNIFNGISYMSKNLILRQKVYSLHVREVIEFYQANGKTYILWVACNTNWKISSVSEEITSGSGNLLNPNANDNLNTNTRGGINTTPGNRIRFTLSNNLALRGFIKVVFESTDNPKHFDDVTLILSINEYYPNSHNGWAGSNIYLDGSKLTFDDVDIGTHQNYQGLFFKWGSLWGIAPNGSNNSPWDPFNNSVYYPNGGSYISANGYLYEDIPYASGFSISSNPPPGKTPRDRAYLYEINDEVAGIGDICKYITDKGWAPGPLGTKWRMPTSNEFEAAGGYTRSGSWYQSMSNSPSGRYSNYLAPGYTKSDKGNPFFPAAGNRESTSGRPTGLGTMGYYWSSSAEQIMLYNMSFSSSDVESNYMTSLGRAYSYPIRCVRIN